MLGHHGCDAQAAMPSRQSTAYGLHGNSVKLVFAGVLIGLPVGAGDRGKRLFGLFQPVRKQDSFKLPRRFLDLGRIRRG